VRVLVAPDKFKGTMTAEQAAGAIARGWRRARPSDAVAIAPLADGGEGTLDALLAARGGERRRVRVSGPLADAVDADYGLVRGESGGTTAVVEMARASGLQLVSEARRDAVRASTFGTGELILAAAHAGAAEVLVSIGGSATTDGGAGMAQAVGARLLDAKGRPVRRGGAGLIDLARVDVTTIDPAVRGARFLVATDVRNPLVGPSGAAAVYGPQKGATPEQVALLDRALGHFAAVIDRDLGIDVREEPGAGAAGGLGAGLVAFLGARLRPGAGVVMDAVGFDERLDEADLAITGEGRLDASSFDGKVVGTVIDRARAGRVPVMVLCGSAEERPDGVEVHELVGRSGGAHEPDPASALEALARDVAAAR